MQYPRAGSQTRTRERCPAIGHPCMREVTACRQADAGCLRGRKSVCARARARAHFGLWSNLTEVLAGNQEAGKAG